MSELDSTLAKHPLPTWRPLAWCVVALLTGAGVFAWRTEIDRVATAPGVVAPLGQVRTVQHPEGGVVEEILVREGDRVRAGQALLKIDLGVGGLTSSEIEVRLDALRLERARLQAEAAQIDLHLPEDESLRQPDLAKAERAAYRGRKREHESSVAVLRDQRTQRELDVESIATRLASARERQAVLAQEHEIVTHLVERKLSPKTAALRTEQELRRVEGEIRALEVALPLGQTALAEARERELFERNRFRKQATDRLREVESEIARQAELAERARSRSAQSLLASPIDGVVKNLAVHTIGGVVAAGSPIVEIVPVDEQLVVEMRISPNDIGQIAPDQPVRVKISTYDYLTYGALDGRIVRIAADATQEPEAAPYFRAVVETDRAHLDLGSKTYPISPGMLAEVEMVLGRRSVAQYLIEPVLKLRDDALTNR